MPGGSVVVVIDLTCERVAIALRRNCVSLRARPLFTSPAGGEPVACLFDSVSRQKTYETGSWSGHETGQVWARLQCTHVWLTRVRTERGCARLG